jgi:hypothetical protein
MSELNVGEIQVLTASMNMTVFWDFTSRVLVEIDRRFRGDHAGNGGSKLLWNSGKFLPDHTV